ncbi:NYN domain-containing protein [Blastococcus sp. SYSU DS1024]
MTTAGQRVSAYVDGFNLYRGMYDARKRRGLWLDLESLLGALLRPGQQLVAVNYFTAMVVGPGGVRQQDYLDALGVHCPSTTVHMGRFQQKRHECRSCGSQWTSYEEKESDVSLGVQLVEDAASGLMDEAWIVSGDSDMAPAIRSARRIAVKQGRSLRVVAVFPPKRGSVTLSQLVDHTLRIFDKVPERHQLPDPVLRATGAPIHRPAHWS